MSELTPERRSARIRGSAQGLGARARHRHLCGGHRQAAGEMHRQLDLAATARAPSSSCAAATAAARRSWRGSPPRRPGTRLRHQLRGGLRQRPALPSLRRRLPQGDDRAGHGVVSPRRARRHPRPLDRQDRRGLIARRGRRGAGLRRQGRAALDEDLAALTGGQAPQDFVRVVQTDLRSASRGRAVRGRAL